MALFSELTPSIRYWSRFSEEKGIDFNGTIVRAADTTVLVDPVPMSAEQITELRGEGLPSAIIVTNQDHRRAAADLRDAFGGAPIWIHETDREMLGCESDRVFVDGDLLPGGLTALGLPAMKSPGESALYLAADGGAWIVGDAIIGRPAGGLALLPMEKIADPAAARQSLARLLERPFDALMLGDGQPFATGGRAALERFLNP